MLVLAPRQGWSVEEQESCPAWSLVDTMPSDSPQPTAGRELCGREKEPSVRQAGVPGARSRGKPGKDPGSEEKAEREEGVCSVALAPGRSRAAPVWAGLVEIHRPRWVYVGCFLYSLS